MRTEAQAEATKKMRNALAKRGKRRVNLDANEVVKGDPASLVIGKEEKPAKRHRPLEPKPKVIKVETIIFDIDQRMEELYPAYNEYLRLNLALIELRKIK